LTTCQNKSLIYPGYVFFITRDSGYISTCFLRECDLDFKCGSKYHGDVFDKLKIFGLSFCLLRFKTNQIWNLLVQRGSDSAPKNSPGEFIPKCGNVYEIFFHSAVKRSFSNRILYV